MNKNDSQWKPQLFQNVWFLVNDPTKNAGVIPAYGNIKAILDNGNLDVRVIEAETSLDGRIPYEGRAIISVDDCASKKKEIYNRIRQANVESKPLHPVSVEWYDLETKRSEYLKNSEYAGYYDMYKILQNSFHYKFDGTELTLTGYRDGKEVKLDFANMTEETYEYLNSSSNTKYKDAIHILKNCSNVYSLEQSELIITDYHTRNEIKLDLSLISKEIFEELTYSKDDLGDEDDLYDINEDEHPEFYDMHRILRGSFRYKFDCTELTLTGYHDGKEVKLDFENMTEEMYEFLNSGSDATYKDAMRILRGSKEYTFEQSELIVTNYYTRSEIKLDLSLMPEEMFEELICSEDDLYDDFEDAINTMNTEGGMSI